MSNQLKIFGGNGLNIAVHDWPVFDEQELGNVRGVLESRQWWRVNGTQVEQFEQEFASFHHSRFALAVSNGTHALELIFLALGIGEGDEVIIPAFTFISTATAIMRCGATPVPVDVYTDTFCMDPAKVLEAITSRTKVIVPVHMAGHGCEMEQLQSICMEYDLKLIEDAAHAHSGEYAGKKLGSFGDASIFSFQQFKLMSAGEGGLLLFQNENLLEPLYRLHNVGRPKNDTLYIHNGLGSNYRMTEFQGTILRAQLTRLTAQTELRQKHAAMLNGLLSSVEGIVPQVRKEKATTHPYYMYMFRYKSKAFGGLSRAKFIKALVAEGIPAYRAYPTVQSTDLFRDFWHSGKATQTSAHTPVADDIAEQVVWIHHKMLLSEPSSVEKLAEAIQALQHKAHSL